MTIWNRPIPTRWLLVPLTFYVVYAVTSYFLSHPNHHAFLFVSW